eukprot:gnl/MRDRNA2_/MRDRNA2_149780_c0_seq1.p1 gnl/MRDRNA2_/MRDRNA2_149780_c0~~gnl/MRDRNA2_/MRDRNA2_149780_c0_seq1.p1  ORF type:complete len:330 (-),score=52.55 gnl/MRDRNA2_/MRDRNA2_149780_c0_seq1:225-1214(-)
MGDFSLACIFHSLIVAVCVVPAWQLGPSTTLARRLTVCSESIMDALAYCNAAELNVVLSNQPGMASCRTESEEVPLHIVAQYFCVMPECLDAVDVLISAGADPNSKGSDRLLSRTALHMLADRSKPGDCGVGEEQLVKALQIMIDGGADPDQEDYERRSPLELAQQRGASRNVLRALGDDTTEISSSEDQPLGESAPITEETKGTESSSAALSMGLIAVVLVVVMSVLAFGMWKCMKRSKSSTLSAPTAYAAAGAAGQDDAPVASRSVTSDTLPHAKSNLSSGSRTSRKSSGSKSPSSRGSNPTQEATRQEGGTNPGPMIIMSVPQGHR